MEGNVRYYTPDAVRVEHRELRRTEHLFKHEQCPNGPEPVRKEILQRIRSVLSPTSIREIGTPSNQAHVVGDDDDDGDGVIGLSDLGPGPEVWDQAGDITDIPSHTVSVYPYGSLCSSA